MQSEDTQHNLAAANGNSHVDQDDIERLAWIATLPDATGAEYAETRGEA